MQYYKISLLTKGKKRVETLEAKNRMSAVSSAKNKFKGSMVLNAEETSTPMSVVVANISKDLSKSSKAKIKIEDKISTIRQIAVMSDAGIAINEILNEISHSTENKQLKEIYRTIGNDIDSGQSLSDSILKYKEEFGHVAIAMTQLGEKTGNISGAYHKLADILENIKDNSKKFKKAIRAPLITLTAMAIAFTILIMVVVPKFKDIFSKFETELPVPTKILLATENVMSNYGLYVVIGMAIAIYALLYMYKHDKQFKYKIDAILIHPKFYLFNKVIFYSTMHRYTLIFGELVKSGIPVAEALHTAVGMVDNGVIKEQLEAVNSNIGLGMSLADAYKQTGLFENMLLQMIKAGETGGQLDAMLDKVTLYYDMRFQDIIDNLSAYIEPIMMFFIAGLVLLMALGIFMPMWDMGKAVKG
ncbi:MAG: type II secretion system F family protein [Epsilonproteobacteria bacterium]|nr:MAG: type II secretion system F family protein [Campylobacterota bacterium]